MHTHLGILTVDYEYLGDSWRLMCSGSAPMETAVDLLAHRIGQLTKELAECKQSGEELEVQLSKTRQREAVIRETVKELQRLHDALTGNGEAAGEVTPVPPPPRRKASQAVREVLAEHSEGLTVGDCVRLLEGRFYSQATNKRNTISTTLYNLKKRGEAVYDPDTGRYSLASPEEATEGN
jgi:hypothetical protein